MGGSGGAGATTETGAPETRRLLRPVGYLCFCWIDELRYALFLEVQIRTASQRFGSYSAPS